MRRRLKWCQEGRRGERLGGGERERVKRGGGGSRE